MKKVIMTLLVISGLCFTQTGMVSEGGMGVWLNANAMGIGDNEDADAQYALSFDYVMGMGLELGVDYWLDDAMDGQMDLGVMYHMGGEGMSWAFGLKMTDFSEEHGDMGTVLSGGGYTEGLMHFGLDYDTDADDDEMTVSFGKLFAMDAMTFGVGYRANTSMMGDGWLTLSVGSAF